RPYPRGVLCTFLIEVVIPRLAPRIHDPVKENRRRGIRVGIGQVQWFIIRRIEFREFDEGPSAWGDHRSIRPEIPNEGIENDRSTVVIERLTSLSSQPFHNI